MLGISKKHLYFSVRNLGFCIYFCINSKDDIENEKTNKTILILLRPVSGKKTFFTFKKISYQILQIK